MGSSFMILSTLLGWFLMLSSVEGGCFEQEDCGSCTNYSQSYFFSCSWCPLSNLCHTYGSLYNDCDRSLTVHEPSKCPASLSDGRLPYNHTLAGQLAVWASLAYVKPRKIDPLVLRKVLAAELPGQYRVLRYIQKHCEVMANYSACALLVAISDVEKNVIVSFEGTQNLDQLFEQFITATVTGSQKAEIGGKVLFYNANVQKLLYPCLKEYLTKLLRHRRDYRLTLTGHSLGGAQAQLAASTLVYDRVIPSNRLIVYTFGAPRFGDEDYAFQFDKLVKTNWRLVQATDPVPRIPPYFLYHTHGEVWFNKPGINATSKYTICSKNEDETCALSQSSVICFYPECVRIHKSYFIKEMGTAYAGKKLAGRVTPFKSHDMQCDALVFS